MVLRDYYCTQCHAEVFDLVSDQTELQMHCSQCGCETFYRPIVNGGCKKRYRYNDFSTDPRDYRGNLVGKPEAFDCDKDDNETPSRNKSGEVIHDVGKFTEDKRRERREKIYHNTNKQRGYSPIYFDAKKSN